MKNPAEAAVEKVARLYSRHEHLADMVVHVLGIVFAINASLWLLFNVTGLPVVVSVTVYCLGLLAMIGFSAAYNLVPHHRPSKAWLRRLDHAAIFIMIAATYTPFAVNRLDPPYGPAILAVIWLSATVGVALKLIFPLRFERASIALYLAMGWMIVTVIVPLSHSMAAVGFSLLCAGGLVYSGGVVFYLIERIPYHKAIWHAAVLLAAGLQFSAVALEFAR
ncbi:MAG: hemolysin III family protein [Alphaproteobacteria bacterium]|nr:hemolysin III family protein [Alphaproteobacteria bacterium]MBV9692900.1 hemolysin III family protein [Alphaproteobacteria bacterium]